MSMKDNAVFFTEIKDLFDINIHGKDFSFYFKEEDGELLLYCHTKNINIIAPASSVCYFLNSVFVDSGRVHYLQIRNYKLTDRVTAILQDGGKK